MIDHWLWNEKPFTRAQAWIDILLNCNYSPAKKVFSNTIITCNRGESLYSLDTWAKRWGWNKSKTRRFLNLLRTFDMITLKPTHLTTHLTVCNYESYQAERNADETQVKRKRNASETQVTPIKEEEERKRKKKVNNNSNANKIGDDSEIYKLVTEFYEYRDSQRPDLYKHLFKNKDTHIKNSVNEVDRLIRLDGYEIDEIRGALTWGVQDSFWTDQIVSLAGLRAKSKNGLKKFHNLFTKYKKQSGSGFTDEFMEDMMETMNNKQETK